MTRAPRRARRWVYVPYDQLSDAIGPLARERPADLGIVMIESPWKAARRPYHQQKLATVLTNGRHFAREQEARGVAVTWLTARGPYADTLGPFARSVGGVRVMEPAERELRRDLAPLVGAGLVEVIPHEGWLTTREQFRASTEGPPWRMDAFYRGVRRALGILVTSAGKPLGGKWSFDPENRKAWRGDPPVPPTLTFEVDDLTAGVVDLIRTHFASHPGELHPELIPASRADALALWSHAKAARLPFFGPYEDAMAQREAQLFHTRISALLNLHRVLPRTLIDDVAALPIPLASQEGFIRQILGWREYMHHVHVETDGLRELGAWAGPRSSPPRAPGDGGYARWAGHAWPTTPGGDAGATPSHLGANRGVPPAYWGTPSGLACLDGVVADVWRDGYSHHITRLMVLSNLAMLLDVSPRELTDWFWVAYTDAYDWVVEPNVLAMGTYGCGDIATTKPYIAGAAYIDRMSDYCGGCAFDPETTCPITRLYWAYLARHEAALATNQRMLPIMRGLPRRSAEERALDAKAFALVGAALDAGERLTPERLVSIRRGKAGAQISLAGLTAPARAPKAAAPRRSAPPRGSRKR